MNEAEALLRLRVGSAGLDSQAAVFKRRQRYMEGKHDLPFAPRGVSAEYLQLREIAPANFLPLVLGAPRQRTVVEGFRTGAGKAVDERWWRYWQTSKMDARLPIILSDSMAHGRGIAGVTRTAAGAPRVTVESPGNIWLEKDPADPFHVLWSVKRVVVDSTSQPSGLLDAKGTPVGSKVLGWVYDDTHWFSAERTAGAGEWTITKAGEHGLGEQPFEAFEVGVDSKGVAHSALDRLIKPQDALNTIRFYTLLAMQFAGARQRGVTGFDPVLRDDQGQPILKKDSNGELLLDANGQAQPILIDLGRTGTDRLLVFPGENTKVWDLEESNLSNYVDVWESFLTTMFAIAQAPPQYMLNKMANLSGDALTAAESTLEALVAELKLGWGESAESLMARCDRAAGRTEDTSAAETLWGDGEARSFAQIVDGVSKLIDKGFPRRAAWQMLPGATPQKVSGWWEQYREELREQGDAVIGAAKLGGPEDLADGDAA